MPPEMFRACGFCNAVPGSPEGLPEGFREGDGQPHMEVRDSTSLKFQNPKIANARRCTAESLKPSVEVLLTGFAVRFGLVVGQTELRDKGGRGVPGQPSET
jgi:hypothetical protein